jgi:hypothetical protein
MNCCLVFFRCKVMSSSFLLPLVWMKMMHVCYVKCLYHFWECLVCLTNLFLVFYNWLNRDICISMKNSLLSLLAKVSTITKVYRKAQTQEIDWLSKPDILKNDINIWHNIHASFSFKPKEVKKKKTWLYIWRKQDNNSFFVKVLDTVYYKPIVIYLCLVINFFYESDEVQETFYRRLMSNSIAACSCLSIYLSLRFEIIYSNP